MSTFTMQPLTPASRLTSSTGIHEPIATGAKPSILLEAIQSATPNQDAVFTLLTKRFERLSVHSQSPSLETAKNFEPFNLPVNIHKIGDTIHFQFYNTLSKEDRENLIKLFQQVSTYNTSICLDCTIDTFSKITDFDGCIANCKMAIHGLKCHPSQDHLLLRIANLTSQLPHLKHLDLSAYPKCANEELSQAVQHLPSLTKICLSGCQAISDTGLSALLLACKNLKQIDLGDSTITDISIEHLLKYTGAPSEVILSGCSKITDKHLIALLKKWPQLTLDVRNCSNIPPSFLHQLYSELPLALCYHDAEKLPPQYILNTQDALEMKCLQDLLSLLFSTAKVHVKEGMLELFIGIRKLEHRPNFDFFQQQAHSLCTFFEKYPISLTLPFQALFGCFDEYTAQFLNSIRCYCREVRCVQTTDDCDISVDETYWEFPQATTVKLENTACTDNSLLKLRCPNLKNIHLSGCNKLTNKVLDTIAKLYPTIACVTMQDVVIDYPSLGSFLTNGNRTCQFTPGSFEQSTCLLHKEALAIIRMLNNHHSQYPQTKHIIELLIERLLYTPENCGALFNTAYKNDIPALYTAAKNKSTEWFADTIAVDYNGSEIMLEIRSTEKLLTLDQGKLIAFIKALAPRALMITHDGINRTANIIAYLSTIIHLTQKLILCNGNKELAQMCCGVTSLALVNPSFTAQELVEIARETELLTQLVLVDCNKLKGSDIAQTHSSWLNLTSIRIENHQTFCTQDVVDIVKTFTELTQLELVKCPKISDRTGTAIAQYTGKYTQFAVEKTDVSSKFFNEWSLSNLHTLSVASTKIDKNFATELKKASQLIHIDLSNCVSINDQFLLEVANHLPAIKSISVQKCPSITLKGLQQFMSRTHLDGIDVRDCKQIPAAIAPPLLHVGVEQDCLRLDLLNTVSDEAMNLLASSFPNITSLHLFNSRQILNIKKLLTTCKHLTQITFQSSWDVTWFTELLSTNTPQITSCSLQGPIRGTSIQHLSKCKNLKQLSLEHIEGQSFVAATDDLAFELLPNMPNLHYIHLAGFSAITASCLTRIVGKNPQIQVLQVKSCSNLSTYDLHKLKELSSSLQTFLF